MANFSPYANFGYAALIKEATAGTALTPTTWFGILSESIVPDFKIQPVQTIAGERQRNVRSVPSMIEMEGDLEFYIEPKTIGHFLRSLFGAPTTATLTASVAFRHVFNVGDTPLTYTIDIQPADAPWVHRFYGCQISKLAIEPADNLLKCTATIMPRKAFVSARVTTAASSGTTLLVDQTSGLVAGDTIIVIDKADGFTTIKELAITSVDSETQLTTATIDVQLDVDDMVVIKRATATYSQDLEITYLGGTALYTGDDIDNTTAENVEEFSIEFNNETEAKFFAGITQSARYAGDVLNKGYFAEGKISKFYDSQSKLDKAINNEKIAMRFLLQGETAIEANAATKARSVYGTGTGFYVECATAGKAGNDYNVTIVIAADDNLAASLSGKNILISLANTTASKNTGTLIAAAVNALTNIDAAAVSTGAEQFTAAIANENLGLYGATAVVGRDASEKPYLQIDFADTRIGSFFPSASEDDILMQEMPFTSYIDSVSGAQKKNWSARLFLVNSVSSY